MKEFFCSSLPDKMFISNRLNVFGKKMYSMQRISLKMAVSIIAHQIRAPQSTPASLELGCG
jgi:hypothetical protein